MANDRIATAYNYFVGSGWSPEQAAGIVANLWNESRLNPAGPAGDGGLARGLGQWHPDRHANLVRYAAATRGSPTDFQTQLGFVNWELQNTESDAGARLRRASTARDAARVFDRHYERSAGLSRSRRMRDAESIFNSASSFAPRSSAGGHGGTPSATAYAGALPPTPRSRPGGYGTALDAVNSYAPSAPKAMAYAPTAPRMVGGAPPPYAIPTSTVGHAAMAHPSTHRPSLPMTPAGASSVVGAGVPTASVVGSGFKPGSWLQQSFRVPVDYGVGAGVDVPKAVPPPGILPTAPKLATPIKARPVVTAPPVIQTDPAAAPTHPAFHPFGGLFANLLGIGNNGSHPGLFGGGILGSLFGGSAGGGKGSPTGGPSGGGYTGLFTGSNPFIRGNATEPQMTTAQYQAMNPGPWSSPSSKKR